MVAKENATPDRITTARETVQGIIRAVETEALDTKILTKMLRALPNVQTTDSSINESGPDTLQSAAKIATQHEDRTVNNLRAWELREVREAAANGQWFDDWGEGAFATRCIDEWVEQNQSAADNYHLTLRSGKIIRYKQYKQMLDRGDLPTD
jgi:hypothetical protein